VVPSAVKVHNGVAPPTAAPGDIDLSHAGSKALSGDSLPATAATGVPPAATAPAAADPAAEGLAKLKVLLAEARVAQEQYASFTQEQVGADASWTPHSSACAAPGAAAKPPASANIACLTLSPNLACLPTPPQTPVL
jgi:hypothetical protein